MAMRARMETADGLALLAALAGADGYEDPAARIAALLAPPGGDVPLRGPARTAQVAAFIDAAGDGELTT